MARCDEGYRCQVCGTDVEQIVDSALYLRYILGEVFLDRLHLLPECHVRCDVALAQYIEDAAFEPVPCGGPFSRSELDPAFVAQEVERVSRGWRRLQAVPKLGLTLLEYPLSITPEDFS